MRTCAFSACKFALVDDDDDDEDEKGDDDDDDDADDDNDDNDDDEDDDDDNANFADAEVCKRVRGRNIQRRRDANVALTSQELDNPDDGNEDDGGLDTGICFPAKGYSMSSKIGSGGWCAYD